MNKSIWLIILIALLILLDGFIIEPNDVAVTNYKISCKEMEGVRLVFLSDLNFSPNDVGRLNKIVGIIKRNKPSAVLLGGDYGKSADFENNLNPYIIGTRLIKLEVPVYAVFGELDNLGNPEKIKERLESSGIIVLNNEATLVDVNGVKFYIVGIADYVTKHPNVDTALQDTINPRIILTHNPDIYYEFIDNVTLILSGHTHGGQIVLPFGGALFVPSKYGNTFAGGMIKKHKNTMIVSRGIGTEKFPFRFNCKPEIVIVDFTK